MANSSSRVNWAMAEALAFGTLALHKGVIPPNATAADYAPLEGLNRGSYAVASLALARAAEKGLTVRMRHVLESSPCACQVRMTGQDVERGTFNQRHYSLVDQLSGRRCGKELT